MRTVRAGGVSVSAIGLGTWQFGSREWGYGKGYDEHEAGLILRRALDLGIDLIDTAEVYGMGRSETIVGRALTGRRDEAFLATKILPVLPIGPIVRRRVQGSLRRLGVDRIDLYQLHQPNPVVPLSATMPTLAALMDDGTIGHVGVSNYSLARWQAADTALGRPVLSNQVRYSLVDRRPERELLPWATANDRLVIAYSPLGQGLLSARYDPDHLPPGSLRRNSSQFLPDNLERARPLLDALRQVADAHRSTPAQVALAWLIRRPNVVVIPGASSVAQVEANAAAADLELADDEDAALRAAAEAFHPVTGIPAMSQLARRQAGRLAGRVAAGRDPAGG